MQDRHTDARRSGGCAIAVSAFAGVVLLAIGFAVWFGLYAAVPAGASGLQRELRDCGRVAVVGSDDLVRIEAVGAQLIAAREIDGLSRVLAGTDEGELDATLARAGLDGLLVDGRGGRGSVGAGASIADRLRAYDHFDVLSGVHLAPVGALYVPRRGMRVAPAQGELLARAARQIVGGASPPRVRSFPEPLRRTRNVEVLVMLRQGDRPRLWRSARGGSIARALVTAATVARERWAEREPAMGGPIDQRLPSMTVEVYLLEEDGTLGERSAPFVERALTAAHGVAFEDRGSWHYLLPEATRERGDGSAVRAYRALFEDVGLPADSLEQRTLRLYRLVARPVGTSEPAGRSGSAPSPSGSVELFEAPGLDTFEAL